MEKYTQSWPLTFVHLLSLLLIGIWGCESEPKEKITRTLKKESEKSVRQGPETTWISEKRIRSVVNYEEGKKTGTALYWDSSGHLWAEIKYSNDTIQHLINYHQNGRKSLEVPYQNGKHHGIATRWNDSGMVVSKRLFKNGAIDSLLYPEKLDSSALAQDKDLLMLLH